MKKTILATAIALMISSGASASSMHHSSYIGGYPNGKFGPDDSLTRAEVAKIIVISNGLETYDGPSFHDVDRDHWAKGYIYTAKLKKYISGYDDGTYGPNINISRGEFASVVYRTIEDYVPEDLKNDRDYRLNDIKNHWSGPFVNVLNKLGVIRGYVDGTFNPEGSITRAEAVSIINRVQGRIPDRDKIDSIRRTVYSDKDFSKHWAYYDIIEASIEHDFYITKDGAGNQVEYWTKFYF